MIEFIFGTVWGWIGTAGIVVIVCVVVGYFFPTARLFLLGLVAIVISAATIYTKGSRDRARLEQKRKDEAVANLRGKYDEINKRPDDPGTVADRLRNGTF